MIAFIDAHRAVYGGEPICRVLPIAPSTYCAHAARRADQSKLPARARSDARLQVEIRRVFEENFRVYGVRGAHPHQGGDERPNLLMPQRARPLRPDRAHCAAPARIRQELRRNTHVPHPEKASTKMRGFLRSEGREFSLSKRDAYREMIELPERTGLPFEIAANIHPELE